MIRKYKKGRMFLLGKNQVTSRILVLRVISKTVSTSIEVLLVVGNMFSISRRKVILIQRCVSAAAT